MSARDYLVDVLKQFDESNDEPATRLFISKYDEIELCKMSKNESGGGDLVERIDAVGIRNALPKFLGLPITWGAAHTHAE